MRDYFVVVICGDEFYFSGVEGVWIKDCVVIFVSVINGYGVDRVIYWIVGLFDG